MKKFLLLALLILSSCDPSQTNPQIKEKGILPIGDCVYLPSKYIQSIDGELQTAITYEKYCFKPDDIDP